MIYNLNTMCVGMCFQYKTYLLNNVLILNKYLHEKQSIEIHDLHKSPKNEMLGAGLAQWDEEATTCCRFSLCTPVSLCCVSNES